MGNGEVFKIGGGGGISNVCKERGLNINMYINYMCAKFYSDICIIDI